MRIDDIDALLATVQFSSLNQAADYLGITQSAITRRLQRLEQELNVTLLARQTRPLTLTAAGQRVYEQCLSIKRETKKLYSLLDPQGEPRGALRLGVPQSISEIALPAALAASPWRDELEVVNLSDFQPAVSLWLIHARYLANLQSPLTFFASKVVQQLTVSD